VANARAGAMVRNITRGIRQNIRSSIETGLATGQNIDQMAAMIRPGLPALPASINRINRQFGERLAKGDSFLKTRRWAQREMSRMRDYRAHMIARTEASAAMSDGALIAYEEAGFRYVEFVAQFDACPECLPFDGEFFRVESMGIIPLHCWCRCTWHPVPASMEPDIDIDEDVIVTAPTIDPLLPAVALGFLEEEE
jgi:SPP1 gp7 family putative phage head morphogenesis protein